MSTRLPRRFGLVGGAFCAAAALLLATPANAFKALPEPSAAARDLEERMTVRLREGARLMEGRQHAEALAVFDEVIAAFEEAPPEKGTVVRCASSAGMAAGYAILGEALGQPTMVTGPARCLAHFLRGYALVELQRPDEARQALERATEMAPHEPHYLSELGHVIGMQGDWPGSLKTFQQAEAAALKLEEEEFRAKELSRAWRGMGYAYIEMGQLDEAEALYLKCLKADSTDKVAASELEYVRRLREKAKSATRN